MSDLRLDAADALAKVAQARADERDDLRTTVASQAKVIDAMAGALTKLANEADGLSIAEVGIRVLIGNSNWAGLCLRIAEARSALLLAGKAKTSTPPPPPARP